MFTFFAVNFAPHKNFSDGAAEACTYVPAIGKVTIHSPIIVAAELSLDLNRKVATLHDTPMTLTAFEYKVLEYLMLNQERIVSKSELTENLYDQDFERDSNVLEVFVGRLRKKMLPYDLIKTIRGQGYKFSADNNDI